MKERGSFHGVGCDPGKFFITNRIGCGCIQRTPDFLILERMKKETDDIGGVDPRHPLLSATQIASQTESKDRAKQRNSAPFLAED